MACLSRALTVNCIQLHFTSTVAIYISLYSVNLIETSNMKILINSYLNTLISIEILLISIFSKQ